VTADGSDSPSGATPERYQLLAEELRQRAERAVSDEMRREFERLAAQYEKLAQRRRAHGMSSGPDDFPSV
jgi:hypothetical protein